MGFNRRKMEDQRREAANKEAASRRATDAQVLEDAERLIAAWNERPGITRAYDLFAHDRRRHQGGLLVPAARRAERSTRSTCARSTVTPTRR
jgi:hypothetical protein